jgi:hypothetical protein
VARGQLAVAASGGGGSASTEAPSLEDLRSGLQEAIKAEDYASAARIRDRIAELEQADPVVQAERELEAAIAEERFEVRQPYADASCARCSRLQTSHKHTHRAVCGVAGCGAFARHAQPAAPAAAHGAVGGGPRL